MATLTPFIALDHSRERALQLAQQCAAMLRERFGARRVIIFGSLVDPAMWHERSDVDLAVEGLSAEQFWKAYGACHDLLASNQFGFDLVELESAPARLRVRILGEIEMPDDPRLRVRGLIEDEFATMDEVVTNIETGIEQLPNSLNPSQIEMRGLASYVHDFYSGVESVLERIAANFDHHVPTGEHSHSGLLEQLAHPRAGERDAMIDNALWTQLHELMEFRHVFRHAYAREMNWNKLSLNIALLRPALHQLRAQVTTFLDSQAG